MVFAAPLFLMSQTKAMRAFMASNSQAFINVGFGLTISYLTMSLLNKMVGWSVAYTGARQVFALWYSLSYGRNLQVDGRMHAPTHTLVCL